MGIARTGDSSRRIPEPRRARRGLAICRPVLVVAAVAVAFGALASTAYGFAPLVSGVSATPTSDGANLNGTIYPYGLLTTYRYEYGTTTGYGANVPVPDGSAGSAAYPGTTQVPETIGGLTSLQTYHYRLVAHNADGNTASLDQTFTTTGPKPTVSTEAATETGGGFLFSGSVDPNGSDAKYRFEYGTTTGYGTNVPVPDADAGPGASAVPVSEEVSGLLPNSTYHFRLTAHNPGGTASTADRTFTTPPSPPAAPAAVVSPPTPVAGGYQLEGAVNPNHLETTYHFEFGTTTAYGTNLPSPDANVGNGEANVPVSQEVTVLAPSTTYHYRIVAHNSEGTTMSLDQAFTTPPEPPTVTSLAATEIPGGFNLNATVNPHGGATAYHFEFGVTIAYGSDVPSPDLEAGSGTSPVAVAVPVTGLPPGTPYHYRVVAHNAGGTSTGEDEFFMTPALPSVLPEPTVSPPPATAAAVAKLLRISSAVAHGPTATLKVLVSGTGTITASGKLIKTTSGNVSGGGTVPLRVRLDAAGRRKLDSAHAGPIDVMARITFRPAEGAVMTMLKRLVFKPG